MSNNSKFIRLVILILGVAIVAVGGWLVGSIAGSWQGNVSLAEEVRHRLVVPQDDSPSSPTAQSFRFLFFGDTGTGKRAVYEIVQLAAELTKRDRFAAFFLLGDNVYKSGKPANTVEECVHRPFRPLFDSGIPCYAILGNHDDNTPGLREYQLEYPLLNMKGHNYYTVSFGKNLVQFFMLDTQTIKGDSAQRDWLRKSLAESQARWKIILMHIPAYASQIAHGDSKQLTRILKSAGIGEQRVSLVLSGHNHLYERRLEDGGITAITCGSGAECVDDKFPRDAKRVVGYNKERAFMWMEVTPEKISLTAVNRKGETIDRAEIK